MTRMSGNPSKAEKLSAVAPLNSTSAAGPRGHDVENWFQAEAEILRESATHAVRRALVVINNVQRVVYAGEYESTFADGYIPGEWSPGDPVPDRLAGDKPYPRRPNGRELQTTDVKRIGYKTNPPPTAPPTLPPTPYSCCDPRPSSNHAPCG